MHRHTHKQAQLTMANAVMELSSAFVETQNGRYPSVEDLGGGFVKEVIAELNGALEGCVGVHLS